MSPEQTPSRIVWEARNAGPPGVPNYPCLCLFFHSEALAREFTETHPKYALSPAPVVITDAVQIAEMERIAALPEWRQRWAYSLNWDPPESPVPLDELAHAAYDGYVWAGTGRFDPWHGLPEIHRSAGWLAVARAVLSAAP